MKKITSINKSLIFLFIISFALTGQDKETARAKLQFTPPLTKTRKERSVEFLEDAEGKKFILKNHDKPGFAVREAIATQIGQTAEININQVEIFPAGNTDLNNSKIVTLHTLVPGCQVSKNKSLYKKINICTGLQHYQHLDTIAEFISLADIVALDIFTNNDDRHNDNLFVKEKSQQSYASDMDFFVDPQTFKFYAIDMNLAFEPLERLSEKINSKENLDIIFSSELLATQTYEFLEREKVRRLHLPTHTSEKKVFSPEEIKALQRVNTTLGKMIDLYPAEKLYNEWMNIAEKAEYTYSPIIQENIKIAVEYNIHEIKRLRSKIDELTT